MPPKTAAGDPSHLLDPDWHLRCTVCGHRKGTHHSHHAAAALPDAAAAAAQATAAHDTRCHARVCTAHGLPACRLCGHAGASVLCTCTAFVAPAVVPAMGEHPSTVPREALLAAARPR